MQKWIVKAYDASTTRLSPKAVSARPPTLTRYRPWTWATTRLFSPPESSRKSSNSKVMKKFFEETKGYRSSRNLEMSKRMKNATQLAAISTNSRNTSSNYALSNMSATSRMKKSIKGSIINNNMFPVRSRTKDNKKNANLRDWNRNRRTDQIARGSVENLGSFKSNVTNKSFEENESQARQATCRSNANLSEVRIQNTSSNIRKSIPRKLAFNSKNTFK